MENYRAFIESIPPNGRLCVYGAGVVAYYFSVEVLHGGLGINCYIVSKPDGNVGSLFGIPVYPVNNMDTDNVESCYVVIATLENLHDDIRKILEENGFLHVYFLKEDEYRKIRQKYVDVSAELYADLRSQGRQFNDIRQWLESRSKSLKDDIHRIEKRVESAETKSDKLEDICLDLRSSVNDYFKDSWNDYKGQQYDGRRYLDEYSKLLQDPADYEKKIMHLLKNLDRESREQILLILGRLHALYEEKQIHYSRREREKVRRMKDDFTNQIYKIAENLYSYQGYILPDDGFADEVFFYKHGFDLLRHPERINGKSIIDAGAYIGDSALIIREYFPDSAIYCFEAKKKNYDLIPLVTELNGIDNVIAINMALSDQNGRTKFFDVVRQDAPQTWASIVKSDFTLGSEKFVKDIGAECTTLDCFVDERKIEIGLIKSDVEGAEQMLLKGSLKTIKKYRPALDISIYHSLEDFFHIKTMIESLDLGYRFRIFHPVRRRTFLSETCLIAEVE